MILTASLLFLFALCLAPEYKTLYVVKADPVNFYDPLIRALILVEVGNGSVLFNPLENAVGWFQIRPIRLEHYNKLRGTSYKLEDFYDYKLSKEMFLYYAHGKDWEHAARDWNGSGHKTLEYWEKIKKLL